MPALFVLLIWANNSSLLVARSQRRPTLLAHRGLAQTFDVEGVKWDTNTARIIHQPEHPYLENTLESMRAAFESGADIVEFDVRLTRDKRLAVFHDYTLEYRTNGTGNVADHTMAELKKLDVGYGYTADSGRTYPFRGKGIGKMPVIDEVLDAFPERELLIHVKDGGEEAGQLLCDYLGAMDSTRRAKISAYGSEPAMLYLRKQYPEMKLLTKSLLVRAFLQYELVGWTGYVPPAMRNMHVPMPVKYARLLWGWPHRYLQRMERVNTRLVLIQRDGGFSSGFDSRDDLVRLPDGYSGCISTDRIDVVAPLLSRRTPD
jgi:glycerophosphoryl diester phosphodiesterase